MSYCKFFTAFIFIYSTISTHAQVNIEAKYDCVHLNYLTPEERMTEYPFNNASKIKLVSILPGNLSFPIKANKINWSQIKDSITLDQPQIDSLSDILFNVGCRTDTISININYAVGIDIAILFYNSSNKLIEFIPVCFNCMNFFIETEKRRRSIGKPCGQKFEIIKSFVQRANLKL